MACSHEIKVYIIQMNVQYSCLIIIIIIIIIIILTLFREGAQLDKFNLP